MLLQAETGRTAGDLSAGNMCISPLCLRTTLPGNRYSLVYFLLGSSPHPSTPDEDDSQTELLIAEEKLSPEDEGQVMARYESKPTLPCANTDSLFNVEQSNEA